MITIAPLPEEKVGDVLHLELAAAQQDFVHPIKNMVEERTEGVAFHAIWHEGTAVGFFKTDLHYSDRHDFAAPGEPGLRGMLIGAQYQGRGLGQAAMRALPPYLAKVLTEATSVLLTVNCRNPGARHVYLSGGWVDTGALYDVGSSGPQHIMRLALPEPALDVSGNGT